LSQNGRSARRKSRSWKSSPKSAAREVARIGANPLETLTIMDTVAPEF